MNDTDKTDGAPKGKGAKALLWRVVKAPAGAKYVKIRSMRVYPGGRDQVPLTQEEADALNEACPGCVELIGLPRD